jgi:putative peptide zinc metalloprotease protein
VQPGDVVLQLINAPLQASLERQAARVAALEAELFNALPGDSTKAADGRAGDARAELSAAQAELEQLSTRVDALSVRAHATGRLALPRAADLPGQFVARGSLVGQVLTSSPPTVRVALPEADATDLRQQQGTASVRLATAPGQAHEASLMRDSVGAVTQLPSAALSTRYGGQISTDPQDPDHLRTLQPVVLVDVRLAAAPADTSERLGERAWVRIDAGWSPPLVQLSRSVRQLVLRRFNPQF